MGAPFQLAPPVAAALARQDPVVALESTLVTHGFAPPQGLEVARASEQAVRAAGATPATVAVLAGTVHVGIAGEELAAFASEPAAVLKVGASDLAAAIAQRRSASTTVAATVLCAARTGIRVMATGGIGGVHRGEAWDASSDLLAVASEPVIVVCAGAKAILDLDRTLEALETLGVPVVGFGTGELPGFYTRETGLRLGLRADTPEAVADLALARWRGLGQRGGVLVVNPPPAEVALDRAEVDAAVARALDEARGGAVRGKALTPFLLGRVAALTGGRAVAVNRRLIVENAALAARIAVALAART